MSILEIIKPNFSEQLMIEPYHSNKINAARNIYDIPDEVIANTFKNFSTPEDVARAAVADRL